MFRFDFDSPPQTTAQPALPSEEIEVARLHEALELPFVAATPDAFEGKIDVVTLTDSLSVEKGTLSASTMAKALGKNNLNASDLLPGEYEGGFKLWEGAIDLCQFLWQQAQDSHDDLHLQGMSILEMGCGHGLPGIVCLRLGAHVDFQDFNVEVLKHLTMFNVSLALRDLDVSERGIRFFGGEFKSVSALCQRRGLLYDRIIASEILYNSETYPSIVDSIADVLKPHGVALIATKMYYFGVGGSLKSFMDFVQSDDRFMSRIIWRNQDTSDGKRAILELTFKR